MSPRCPTPRPLVEQTLDEKYSGLGREGEFAAKEWAGRRGMDEGGKNPWRNGMQRGCKSGENLISRDKSLNVPRSLARRRESTRSQPGMSLASSKPRRRRRRRRRPLTRFANFAFLHNLARERVIKFIHARERAVNRKAREKAMENFKIETRILSLSLSLPRSNKY